MELLLHFLLDLIEVLGDEDLSSYIYLHIRVSFSKIILIPVAITTLLLEKIVSKYSRKVFFQSPLSGSVSSHE